MTVDRGEAWSQLGTLSWVSPVGLCPPGVPMCGVGAPGPAETPALAGWELNFSWAFLLLRLYIQNQEGCPG